MFHFEIHEKSFLPHLGCELSVVIGAGDAILLKGENGLGKSSILRYLWQKYGNSKISWITQEPLDYFYDRNLATFKSLFLEANSSLIDRLHFDHLWEAFGFDQKLSRTLSQLSGGEGQMLKLLCGLCKSSELFIMDEPYQFLDREKKKLLNQIIELMREKGKSFIMVEHDESIVTGKWRVLGLSHDQQMIRVGSEWTI